MPAPGDGMHVNTINTLNWHCFIVLSCGVHAVHTDQARNQTIRACGHHSPTQSNTPLFVVFVTTLARLSVLTGGSHHFITQIRGPRLPAASIQRITHNNRRDKDGNEERVMWCLPDILSHNNITITAEVRLLWRYGFR